MTRARASLPSKYFEEMFAATPDPWGFETSPYEQAKYNHAIAALGGRRYRRALEVGCANGVLTQRLSEHCDTLLALDVSATALARARTRCAGLRGIGFFEMSFPRESPEYDTFDLIVLSEVAYYWDDGNLALAASRLLDLLAAGGDVVLVHWTGETDYPQTGDAAVETLQRMMGVHITTIMHERQPQYRLDFWRRPK